MDCFKCFVFVVFSPPVSILHENVSFSQRSAPHLVSIALPEAPRLHAVSSSLTPPSWKSTKRGGWVTCEKHEVRSTYHLLLAVITCCSASHDLPAIWVLKIFKCFTKRDTPRGEVTTCLTSRRQSFSSTLWTHLRTYNALKSTSVENQFRSQLSSDFPCSRQLLTSKRRFPALCSTERYTAKIKITIRSGNCPFCFSQHGLSKFCLHFKAYAPCFFQYRRHWLDIEVNRWFQTTPQKRSLCQVSWQLNPTTFWASPALEEFPFQGHRTHRVRESCIATQEQGERDFNFGYLWPRVGFIYAEHIFGLTETVRSVSFPFWFQWKTTSFVFVAEQSQEQAKTQHNPVHAGRNQILATS